MPLPYDPYPHRRGEPRQYVLWYTGYVLCSSVLAFSSVNASIGYVGYEVTRPAATMFLAMIGLGIGVLWPMVRLSQAAPGSTVGENAEAFALDALVMVVPACVVAISQAMPWMSGWPPQVAATLMLLYLSWSVLAAAGLTRVLSMPRPRRVRAMVQQVSLSVAGPVVAGLVYVWTGGEAGPLVEGLMASSPITGPLELTANRAWSGEAAAVSWWHVAAAGAPGVLGLLCWGWWGWWGSQTKSRN